MTTDLTVNQLIAALQKSKAQGVTIFADGVGWVSGSTGRYICRPRSFAFRSLPELQRFVDEVNGTGRASVVGRASVLASPDTSTANAS